MRTAFAAAVFFLLAAAATSAEQPAEPVKVGAFTFTVPDGWKKVTPSSPMRKAQLDIAQGSDKAEVTFFQFGAGQGGMPGGPTTPLSGYALCGAILESPDGNVFIKMTGPEAVVHAATEAFKKMV